MAVILKINSTDSAWGVGR